MTSIFCSKVRPKYVTYRVCTVRVKRWSCIIALLATYSLLLKAHPSFDFLIKITVTECCFVGFAVARMKVHIFLIIFSLNIDPKFKQKLYVYKIKCTLYAPAPTVAMVGGGGCCYQGPWLSVLSFCMQYLHGLCWGFETMIQVRITFTVKMLGNIQFPYI